MDSLPRTEGYNRPLLYPIFFLQIYFLLLGYYITRITKQFKRGLTFNLFNFCHREHGEFLTHDYSTGWMFHSMTMIVMMLWLKYDKMQYESDSHNVLELSRNNCLIVHLC